MSGSWLVHRAGPPPPGSTLVLHFPYVGAHAATYLSWVSALGPGRHHVGVELPGRGSRFDEPFAGSVDEVADAVAAALAELPDRDLVLFGHSLGALAAYETAVRLEAAGRPVAALVVSGNRAPTEDLGRPVVSDLPDERFLTRVAELGLADPASLADPELAELFAPVLRADLRLSERYPWGRATPVRAPLTVLGARHDALAPAGSLRAWAELGPPPPDVREFTGGHLFVHERSDEVAAVLRQAGRTG